MTDDIMDDWADYDWASYYARVTEIPGPEKIDEFLAILPQQARVLDFGCGNLRWGKAFLRDRPDLTIDLVDRCLDKADMPPDWPGVGYHTSFQDFVPQHAYDGIWAFNALFFLRGAALEKVLRTLAGCLRQGGKLFFTMVEASAGADRFNFHGQTWENVARLVEQAGLKVESRKYREVPYGIEQQLVPRWVIRAGN